MHIYNATECSCCNFPRAAALPSSSTSVEWAKSVQLVEFSRKKTSGNCTINKFTQRGTRPQWLLFLSRKRWGKVKLFPAKTGDCNGHLFDVKEWEEWTFLIKYRSNALYDPAECVCVCARCERIGREGFDNNHIESHVLPESDMWAKLDTDIVRKMHPTGDSEQFWQLGGIHLWVECSIRRSRKMGHVKFGDYRNGFQFRLLVVAV